MTDNDGRCNTLLPPGTHLEIGIFKITFFTNEYFTKRGILSFYPFIEVRARHSHFRLHADLQSSGLMSQIPCDSHRFRSKSSLPRSITSPSQLSV